jgi:hypothetical protein
VTDLFAAADTVADTVADKLEIIEVCTRVHWCYDHQEWDGLDALFADVVSMPTLAQAGAAGFAVGRYLDDYLFTRDELKRALSSVKDGLTTQHLIAGHQVTLDGDSAVCLAQSINVHLTSGMAAGSGGEPAGDLVGGLGGALVAHGNDYRFDLVRTGDGWRIRGWVPRIRWSYGNESSYDATAKQAAWLRDS